MKMLYFPAIRAHRNQTQSRKTFTAISLTSSRSAVAVLALATALLATVTATRAQETEVKKPTFSVLYTFTGGADGATPGAGALDFNLLWGDGKIYGTANSGGNLSTDYCTASGCGVVFRVDDKGKETVLHTFAGPPDGAYSYAGVTMDEAGNLYGTTAGGGDASFPAGTVFKLSREGKETIRYNFTGSTDGNGPNAGLLRGEEGKLYGTTSAGGDPACNSGAGCGVVFKLDEDGRQTVLYSFTGGADGSGPQSTLLRDDDGNLYGTTLSGGASAQGVIFKLSPAGKLTVVHTFTGTTDGGQPASLIRDKNGNFYGTDTAGGNLNGCFGSGCGVVFKLDCKGKFSVLYTFTGGTDGGVAYGQLLKLGDDLYGTTFFGGDPTGCGGLGCGVVYKLDSAGKETALYSFTGEADGANPTSGVVTDGLGHLYGATAYGGDLASPAASCYGSGCGVIFKIKLPDQCWK